MWAFAASSPGLTSRPGLLLSQSTFVSCHGCRTSLSRRSRHLRHIARRPTPYPLVAPKMSLMPLGGIDALQSTSYMISGNPLYSKIFLGSFGIMVAGLVGTIIVALLVWLRYDDIEQDLMSRGISQEDLDRMSAVKTVEDPSELPPTPFLDKSAAASADSAKQQDAKGE